MIQQSGFSNIELTLTIHCYNIESYSIHYMPIPEYEAVEYENQYYAIVGI